MASPHPGYPVIASAQERGSDSRPRLNAALRHFEYQNLTATANVDPDLGLTCFCDVTAGNATYSLPDPTASTANEGLRITFIRTNAGVNTITIDSQGSGININGAAATLLPNQYDSVTVISNDAQWWIYSTG